MVEQKTRRKLTGIRKSMKKNEQRAALKAALADQIYTNKIEEKSKTASR